MQLVDTIHRGRGPGGELREARTYLSRESAQDKPYTGAEGIETLDDPAGVRRVERAGRNARGVREPARDQVETADQGGGGKIACAAGESRS